MTLQVAAAAITPSEEYPHHPQYHPHPALERGKFLAYPFKAEQFYRIYKELQQDYHNKAFHYDGSNQNEYNSSNKNKNKNNCGNHH
jgi:hypothetical protein